MKRSPIEDLFRRHWLYLGFFENEAYNNIVRLPYWLLLYCILRPQIILYSDFRFIRSNKEDLIEFVNITTVYLCVITRIY